MSSADFTRPKAFIVYVSQLVNDEKERETKLSKKLARQNKRNARNSTNRGKKFS